MISVGTTFILAAGKGYRKPGLCRDNGAVLSTDALFVSVIKLLLANERLRVRRRVWAGANVKARPTLVICWVSKLGRRGEI